jgi:hypothetical protein
MISGRIEQAFLDRVKERVRLAELVSAKVVLKRAGKVTRRETAFTPRSMGFGRRVAGLHDDLFAPRPSRVVARHSFGRPFERAAREIGRDAPGAGERADRVGLAIVRLFLLPRWRDDNCPTRFDDRLRHPRTIAEGVRA